MYKRNLLTKCSAYLLMTAMVTSMLTGCKGETTTSAGTTMDKEHVYHGEYFELPDGLTSINTLKVINDRIYVDGYNEKNNYLYEIISMNTDGSDSQTIYQSKSDEDGNIAQYAMDQDGNVYLYHTIYNEVDETEEAVAAEAVAAEVEPATSNYIMKIDSTGKQVQEEKLDVSEEFYPNSMLVDGSGNLMLLSYDCLQIYDKDIKPVTSVDTSNSYVDSAFLTDDGKIMITQYTSDYSSREIKQYDESTKEFTQPKSMGENMSNYSFYQATGYDLFMKDSTDLYGFDMESGEKTKILNWIDSDINGNNISGLAGLSDGRIVCVTTNWVKNTSELVVLTKVDPKDVVDKTVLTLATVYGDDLSGPIIEFNKKSDKYRISMKDYSIYNTDDDYMVAYNKLNTDIISGDIPDILSVNDQTPMESYISKGLFVNLYDLMDQDKDFKKEDYLSNIFEAFESNGKLYSAVPYFSPYSVVGKTSVVGDKMGWTMEDLNKVMASQPEGTKAMTDVTNQTIMYYGSYICMDEFVDWEKGTCNFESQGFKNLLEFASQFPTQEEFDKQMENDQTEYDEYTGEDLSYKKGTTLLQTSYLSDFKEFHRLQKITFGEDLTFIGFPSESTNGSAISPGLQLAISSKAASMDAAWEFVKSFYTDESQDNYSYQWPVKLSSLEKKKEKEQKAETYTDENGKEVEYDETYMENGKEKKLGTPTDEECEKVITFLKSLNHVLRYDENINTIIDEETGAYFAGQKSVDETCKLIQNRVQTYMSETK